MSSPNNPNEVWQIMIEGQVYEADTNTLKEWAAEGRVLPTDKVKKGSLNWNDANRIPMLRAIFSGETPSQPITSPLSPPSSPSSPSSPITPSNQQYYPQQDIGKNPTGNLPSVYNSSSQYNAPASGAMPVFNPATGSAPMASPTGAGGCTNHPDLVVRFICRMCNAPFCKDCPKMVGSVAICPACGDMCNKAEEIIQKANYTAKTVSDYGSAQDFGVNEFAQALKYPFRHKIPLIFGTIVYAFFTLGSEIGGRQASLIATVFATVFLFGCMSLAIRQVSLGRIANSFLPDFSAFSIYDDIIRPLGLSISVSVITFAPIVVLVVALAATGKFAFFATPDMMPPPPEPIDVKSLIEGNDPDKDLETMKRLQQMEPTRDLGVRDLEKKDKEKQKEQEMKNLEEEATGQYLKQMIAAGAVALLIIGLGLIWAFFYYPMAITIAGFTQDFKAVLNPTLGFDTMKTMGNVYVRAFLMYATLTISGLIIKAILAVIMLPILVLPYLGLAVYNTVSGVFTFYTSLVLSCILGLALYKCADKLDIIVDK
ncbi:MAG: hypothetical protein HY819_01975 [Acidobacteria bacterium]|nr:hypothetical protein [Acidobacteriota bacterium]